MPRHVAGPAEAQRSLDAYVKLLRAAKSVTARAMARVAAAGLTPTQFAVLEAMYHAPQPQRAMCLSEIAGKILTSGGNLTMVVNNLERRGLAQRQKPARDRRYVQLAITPRGAKLLAELFPAHLGDIVAAMAALTPGQQQELAALCKTLGVAAAKQTQETLC